MIRNVLAATALLLAVPAAAQSQQDQLDARYDRALAAGYKALMLCGAIANAEANGTTRTPESVEQWELTGIQAPLDGIVGELPFDLYYDDDGMLDAVAVGWEAEMPPRLALFRKGAGCAAYPIGYDPAFFVVEDNGASLQRHHSTPPSVQNVPAGLPVDRAFEGTYGNGSRTTAITIVSPRLPDGKFAFYADGFDERTPQRTWSVAKSIASTLIGTAVYRDEVDVEASAGLGLDDTDPRRAITIDHLLRMASGRYSDTPGNRTDPLYWGGATVDEVALDWPLVAEPGSTYRYANNDTLAAIAAIEFTFAEHPPAAFFKQLGMRDTTAETDWQGNYILSSQVWTTARDLATFGQLYLNDGVLADGTRILPEGWVEYVSTPSGPQPDGPFGYGAGFWLLNKSEGVPPDTFAAFGNRGQYVVIVPSRNVVIVRRGEDPAGSRFDIVAFTRDVLAALED